MENSRAEFLAKAEELSAAGLFEAVQHWQSGQGSRDEVLALLRFAPATAGQEIQETLGLLVASAREAVALAQAEATPAVNHNQPTSQTEGSPDETDAWRSELLASRARTWGYPHSCGLLVGPTRLILTDGQQGVILQEDGTRLLSTSISGSLLLLCQTIVMAQSAVDAQEVGKLRQQRIESSSTSLSEIEPIT